MKECEGEGSEVLVPLVKILKYQEYCEWILKKDVKDSFIALHKNDGWCWYEGLVEITPSIVVQLFLNRVVEVDIASHRLLRVNGDQVSGIEHNVMLDLSDDGERWEGDVLNNQPYGWGVAYDSENRIVYDGFRIGEVNVCYGTRYYSDIGVIEYEGEWCEGKRWGRGVQYNRTGKVMSKREWMNDDNMIEKAVVLIEENQRLHSCIEELTVSNKSCNGPEWSTLDLSFMFHLRLLEVGDNCLQYVKEVKLIGMNRLERVVIGEKCFTKKNKYLKYDTTRHFYLKNCERLRELKIGRASFSYYSVCEIENLSSLEVIEMGELNEGSCNFNYASLEMKSFFQRME